MLPDFFGKDPLAQLFGKRVLFFEPLDPFPLGSEPPRLLESGALRNTTLRATGHAHRFPVREDLWPHRTLVRYRITATDLNSASVRIPSTDDPRKNFALYVYDGGVHNASDGVHNIGVEAAAYGHAGWAGAKSYYWTFPTVSQTAFVRHP
jgi:hypothetical protein